MQELRQGSLRHDFQQDQEVRDATQSVSEATLKAEKLRLHITQGNSPSLCPPAPKKGWGKLVFDYADQMWVRDLGEKGITRYGAPVTGLVDGREVYFDIGPARYKGPSVYRSKAMKHTRKSQLGKKSAIKVTLERLQQEVAKGNVSLQSRSVTKVKATKQKDAAS